MADGSCFRSSSEPVSELEFGDALEFGGVVGDEGGVIGEGCPCDQGMHRPDRCALPFQPCPDARCFSGCIDVERQYGDGVE